MKKLFRWGLLGAVVLGLAGLAVLAGQRGTPVQVVTVLRTDIVQSVLASGRINTPARLDLGAEVTAMVLEVAVREGDRVAAGALLVRLSDDEARAALQQAQAALAEARARATSQATLGAPLASQVLAQAEISYRAAGREQQRAHELVAQGFFSQQRLDDAQRVLETARSALAQARLQVQANQASGVEPLLAATRVDQAAAALAVAQARLQRLRIVSPLDALVLARHVEPGGMAQPGRVLLVLAAQGGLRIDADIDEKHLRLLVPGMAARAQADAFPGQPFDARLDYIGPAVDPQRGTVEVRLALLPAAPDFLRPDMTVSVELTGAVRPQALVLPSLAVRDADTQAPWVLRLSGRYAERVAVQLGLRGIGSMEISGGLTEGDLVIPQTEKALPGERVRRVAGLAEVGPGIEVPAFISR